MAFSDCKLALFDFDETLSAADSLLWLFSSLMPSLKGEIYQNLPPNSLGWSGKTTTSKSSRVVVTKRVTFLASLRVSPCRVAWVN